jgi:hypothetical protein
MVSFQFVPPCRFRDDHRRYGRGKPAWKAGAGVEGGVDEPPR